jgi:Tfp pilus assembly protein PilF
VQDEIAGLIAHNLSLKLGARSPRVALAVSPQAFELYVQARQAWSLRPAEGFVRAEQLLNRALEFAPDFVRARAALIDVIQMRSLREGRIGSFGQRNFPELDRLLEQVRGVLAIEPDLAEAYATLGTTLEGKWNWAEAERAYRRATELNPNYATGRHWFGMYLAQEGRMEEALAELKLASELDPLSFIILDNYGWLLYLAGRHGEALRMLDRALALNPGFDQTIRIKASVLAALGRASEATALARQIRSLDREMDVYLLAMVGLKAEAGTLWAGLDPRTITNRFRSLLAVGRREEALAALDDPSGVGYGDCIELSFQPFFDQVRDDPRFVKYLATLGLTEAHARAQAWRAAHPPEKPEAKP